MTLGDVKKSTLALIEELNMQDDRFTDDEDILNKINRVCNSVQMELAQIRKIEKIKKYEIDDETVDVMLPDDFFQFKEFLEDFEYSIFSNKISIKDGYTGEITLHYYAYPEEINENTKNNHELEIDIDAQNIMPYGIASDILKADISANYTIYEAKYQEAKERLKQHSKYDNITINGGIDI